MQWKECRYMFIRCFASRKSWLAVFAALALLLTASCGSRTSASVTNPLPTATVSPVVHSDFSAMAILRHIPSGTATFDWDDKTHTLMIHVELIGLAPGSTHPAHIHAGSCEKQGRVLYPLVNVVADAHGVGDVTTKIDVPGGIPSSGWYLNIHNGPGLSPSEQFLPIVCGDIVNHTSGGQRSQNVEASLLSAPPASSGQSASGLARLTLLNHTLTVELMLTGLVPKSRQMAHVHAGSCASQGPVVYPLMVITADAQGKAMVTTTIHNVTTLPSTGWYVNVHRSTDLSTQTGFDPVACGDVEPVGD